MNEEMTDRQTDRGGTGKGRREGEGKREREREKLQSGGVGSPMEKHCYPEAQYVYYIELNREPGLLHPDKQGGRVYGIQLDPGDRFR